MGCFHFNGKHPIIVRQFAQYACQILVVYTININILEIILNAIQNIIIKNFNYCPSCFVWCPYVDFINLACTTKDIIGIFIINEIGESYKCFICRRTVFEIVHQLRLFYAICRSCRFTITISTSYKHFNRIVFFNNI